MAVTPVLLPAWTVPVEVMPEGEGEPRDPLRTQQTLDCVADGLFRAQEETGPGLTSLTDHLGYLAFHGWAEQFVQDEFGSDKARSDAYRRLVWIHAWVNLQLMKSDGRWIVYGILDLRRIRRPIIPGGSSPKPLVQIDPRARYAGLWRAVSPAVRESTVRRWPRLTPTQRVRIKSWSAGQEAGLSGLETATWKPMRLNNLTGLVPLAKELQGVRLPDGGLGYGLRSATLGDVLRSMASEKLQPSPDALMWEQLSRPRPSRPDRVAERLRRALIARAIVFATNWAFFAWAESDMREPDPQFATPPDGCPFSRPLAILQRTSELVRGDRGLREALRAVDLAVGLRPNKFSLRAATEQPTMISSNVIGWARAEGKGFVTDAGHVNKGKRELIGSFTGSYAGGLRLRPAWRFGRDIRECLA